MKKSRKSLEIFSLSFLDIISCGFGAVVLLVLISNYSEAPLKDVEQDAVALLEQVMRAEQSIEKLQRTFARVMDEAASKEVLLDRLMKLAEGTKEDVKKTATEAARTRDDVAGLSLVQKSLERATRATLSADTVTKRDEEVGGIPVDSDYVVFIIDTSGSMKQIWSRVTAQVENIIRIHPTIKGFQVLNDNGAPILSAYSDKWIPDTPARRKGVIELLKTWKSASNSSPVEGLGVALKRYANPNLKVSIYIFGDDYSGNSYDQVIDALDTMNTNRITGQRLARVHGVGFLSPYSTMRFATLMREVTRRNNGTFIALPP